VACLVGGPVCHDDEACRKLFAERGRELRREVLAKPAIFVGMGTCGLGAGAGKTIAAVRAYLAEHKVDADIVEVGCIGLCTAEPIVEVQLPGRTRLSYGSVKAGKVPGLLAALLAGKAPPEDLLGQHRAAGLEAYPRTGYLDEHPFFKLQTRWVLANCGIIDPTNIDEYIARGGYKAFA
jgi:(2Fe-2S) ferredoxin